ncbi:MAG: NAD(P)-binding domain-containing protein, partial [Candidatus Acidiferrales bacterium]
MARELDAEFTFASDADTLIQAQWPSTLSLIGAGRVGRALGRALRERGWRIGTVVTRSRRTARAAVRAIGAGTPALANTPPLLAADVILIAAPDRAIAQIANQIAVGAGLPRPSHAGQPTAGGVKPPLRGKIVLHTSGSLSHDVLAPLRAQGAAIAAVHPMQTFGRGARTRLDGVVFGLDGDARAVRVAQQI